MLLFLSSPPILLPMQLRGDTCLLKTTSLYFSLHFIKSLSLHLDRPSLSLNLNPNLNSNQNRPSILFVIIILCLVFSIIISSSTYYSTYVNYRPIKEASDLKMASQVNFNFCNWLERLRDGFLSLSLSLLSRWLY